MLAISPLDALGVPFQICLEFFTNVFKNIGPLNTIGAFGLAVIVTTIIIRGGLFPIFGWQLRTSRRIQSEQRLIAPQLAELRKKYKKEPQKLSEEMKKLYAEHQVSPFSSLSGCLPALVQMPVLIGLYRGISAATTNLHSGLGFLWVKNVSESGLAQCCNVAGKTDYLQLLVHPAVLILPLLAAVLTFAQSRMMMPPPRPDMTDQERTMGNVTKQMSVIFPVIILFLSLNFPQGLALYWVTGTLFMVIQQYHLVGWGSLTVPSWLPGAQRTTSLSYPKPPPAANKTASNTTPATTTTPSSRTTAAKPRLGPDGNGRKPSSNGRPTVPGEPGTARVIAGAVNVPPARPPKRRSNKRRR
ncbi:MAG: membrane protein insertase YidC [Candidatus Dormibacteraeota bacterium]|uniref:Membrane protein insertase YidC n=1 Tax=Candidatus Amunia macphersoniae TaxID=3127014 RepID=A0A934KI06_9BACT|nr:membrane protein insertase YidC [Candidatus Dormibacteraeota bacterium]